MSSDELRRRELPSFELARADIAKLAETTRRFQAQSTALLDALKKLPSTNLAARVTRTAAFFAARGFFATTTLFNLENTLPLAPAVQSQNNPDRTPLPGETLSPTEAAMPVQLDPALASGEPVNSIREDVGLSIIERASLGQAK